MISYLIYVVLLVACHNLGDCFGITTIKNDLFINGTPIPRKSVIKTIQGFTVERFLIISIIIFR